ncbi:hypothetical protein BV95_04509 [Sphingobium chlorophenolicum]|uniref:Uncharacterized protein n=1 Tax=Sphingobium chlorophenolicum TaxID=46429 RepID=A0A081R4S2_SPHCR|nr:hypothetical protein BV95_04509 [Sphingobium chlorophenolicum]
MGGDAPFDRLRAAAEHAPVDILRHRAGPGIDGQNTGLLRLHRLRRHQPRHPRRGRKADHDPAPQAAPFGDPHDLVLADATRTARHRPAFPQGPGQRLLHRRAPRNNRRRRPPQPPLRNRPAQSAAPNRRPGHAGHRQKQDHPRRQKTHRPMQVAPEQPPARPPPQRQRPVAGTRPAQVKPGHAQQDRPARHHLHQPVADRPGQRQAVQILDRPHDAAVRQTAQYPPVMGIDEPDRPADRQPPAFIGGGGPLHLAHRAAAGFLDRRDQPRRGQHRPARPHHDPVMIDGPLDLRLVEIERARHRHQRQHRQHDQPGIEMPAPHRPIE